MSEKSKHKIQIQVLDKTYSLEEFSLEVIPKEISDWKIGGITDPLGQLITWLWEQISGALDVLENTFWGFLTTIRDQITKTFTDLINALTSTISGLFDSLKSAVEGFFNSIISSISNVIDTINTTFTTIIDTLASTSAQILAGVESVFQAVVSGIIDIANNIWSYIQQIPDLVVSGVETLINTLSSSVSALFSTLQGWLTSAFNTLTSTLSQVWDFISQIPNIISTSVAQAFTIVSNTILSALNTISSTLQALVDSITSAISFALSQIHNALIGFVNTITTTFGKAWELISSGLGEVKTAIAGFVNPLIQISQFLVKLPENLASTVTNFFTKTLPDWIGIIVTSLQDIALKVWDFLTQTVIPTIINSIKGLTSFIFDAVKTIIAGALNIIYGLGEGIARGVASFITNAINFAKEIGKATVETAKGIIEEVSGQLGKAMEGFYKGLLDKIKKGEKIGEWEIFATMGASLFAGQMLARAIYVGLMKLGYAIGQHNIGFGFSLRIVGAKGETKPINIRWDFGGILMHIAKEIKEIPDELGKAIMYGVAIWMSQPLAKAMNYYARNLLPVELPSLATMREIVQRTMPISEKFKELISTLTYNMSLYGYSDTVIEWFSKQHTEENWYVNVKDRFGKDRKFPISLIYDLPSGSDLCRMMIHDIILNVGDFEKAMLMKGFCPDISYLYYLLHYRYPPLEKLWEFYCRAKANMLWLDKTFLSSDEKAMMSKANLGYEPVPPVNLQKNPDVILDAIGSYAKWWDYAFFSWKSGMTSDRCIAIEMMADIPMRIDARWMYKWQVPTAGLTKPFTDEEVKRIVIARGYHPSWVEPITIAECMNALAEERTYARTGVINSYKEGFLTESDLTQTLSKLTTVKILGKEIEVKFLEGEVKLLTLRAKFDRALDVLRDYTRELVRSIAENIIPFDQLKEKLKTSIQNLANSLGIKLALDDKYLDAYKPVTETYKEIYTTHRVRTWLRYMMFRLLTRFSQGYMKKEEMEKIIEELITKGKLTDTERKLLTDIAQSMFDVFTRTIKAEAILRKLSRGTITKDVALKELVNLGIPSDVADDMIEGRAKVYTPSVLTLITMAEYIPIPKEKLIDKMEKMGVPKDEQNLFYAYYIAREIDDELKAIFREIAKDFEDGEIDEKTFKDELDKLATLDGKVKQIAGVDWIIWSPTERELLIWAYKLRRERKARKRR